MEQPALLGRRESAGLGKTIVAKRTVEGLRGALAAMVYASQINADLYVRFVPAATIACCHELILSTTGARSPKLRVCQGASSEVLKNHRFRRAWHNLISTPNPAANGVSIS
jgi:hypothetical protein